MKKTGLIVGKFYPLHQGHLNMILSAKLAVDQLHVFVCSDTIRDQQLYLESAFTKTPSSQNRVNWAKELLAGISGIIVHEFNEDGIPAYPNGWQAWSDRLKETLKSLNIHPTTIFSSELQDQALYEEYFQTNVSLVDPPRDKFPVSATKIRHHPFQYWTYIPTIIRSFFTKTLIIDQNICRNTSLLPAILQLFNAVEVEGFEKIKFLTITDQEIQKILEDHNQDQREISAIIGTQPFISRFQSATDHAHLLQRCEILSLSSDPSDFNTSEQKCLLFNEISSFINRLMLQE